MSAVGEVAERKDRPAYVRFERTVEEDIPATQAAGHFVGRDVDIALITPPYSKDIFKQKIEPWKESMKLDVQNGRMPEEWMTKNLEAYKRFQNGQEMPIDGIPIKGWGVISPAMQQTLIAMNVLTVEDLAAMNDEGIKRIGMGGTDLKVKAKAWLSQLEDKGPLTLKAAKLEQENVQMKGQIETLTKQVEGLLAHAKAVDAGRAQVDVQQHIPQSAHIRASDLLDEQPATQGKRQQR